MRIADLIFPIEYCSIVRKKVHSAGYFSYFVLIVFGFLIITGGTAYSQTRNFSEVLKEISTATETIANKATPAVVGIWVDIKPSIEQTASDIPLDEGQMQNHVSMDNLSNPNQPENSANVTSAQRSPTGSWLRIHCLT